MSLADLDDLFAAAAILDPHSHYARLRELDPVHWNDRFQLWMVTRYEDVIWLVRRPELFSSAVIKNDDNPPYPPVDNEDLDLWDFVREFRASQLVEQDAPKHLEMRKVMRGIFTPKTMETWRPFIRSVIDDLLDKAEACGRMDVLADLAAVLPVHVICRMMEVPAEDREHLRELAGKLLYINRGEPYRLRVLSEGIRGMLDYIAPLVEERLESPGDDFVSMVAEGEQLDLLSRFEVLSNIALLFLAGHETTMNLIANGTLAFLRHPEEWARFRSDPEGMIKTVTEECLRYDPPVKSTQRIAAAEVELGGKTLRKGDRLRWVIAAANRDPEVFSDPDSFDVGRWPNRHITFGGGAHHCLGAALSRLEGQEVFLSLAERFDALQLGIEEAELEYHPSLQFRSLKSLPVTWQ